MKQIFVTIISILLPLVAWCQNGAGNQGINNQLTVVKYVYWSPGIGTDWYRVEIKNHSAKTINITICDSYQGGRRRVHDIDGDLHSGESKSFSGMTGTGAKIPNYYINYTFEGVEYIKDTDDGIQGFNLSSYKAEVFKGNMYQLTTDSGDPITWSSDNSQIAKVDSKGLITAVSEGTTVINATSSDNPFMASCIVKVISNAISISQNSANLFVDDKLQLSYSNVIEEMPVKSVSWKSSDEKIVSVNSEGMITAESQGTAVVTVTSDEGYGEASCIVTVKKHPLTITANNQQRIYGDENPTFTLSYSGFVNGDSEEKITKPTILCNQS